MNYIVALVTVPSEEVGTAVAQALLDRRLVACVNIVPAVNSLYVWEGELCSDDELLLIIKSKAALFDELASVVQDVHPYEVPEIIALPIVAGSQDYLDWIEKVTGD